MAKWIYQGDVNLEYGGMFLDISDVKYDYINCIEVTDLESACGYDGAFLIEEKSINLDEGRYNQALSTIGASLMDSGDINDNGTVIKQGSKAYYICLAYALNAYGCYDIDASEVVAIGKEAADSFEGFKLDTRLRGNATLRNYVKKNWLR